MNLGAPVFGAYILKADGSLSEQEVTFFIFWQVDVWSLFLSDIRIAMPACLLALCGRNTLSTV